MSNYIDDIADRIADRLQWKMSPTDRELARLYSVLALTTGPDTTCVCVHDAWAAWKLNAGFLDHPALVPFDELSREKQDLDLPYRDAILAVVDEIEAIADGCDLAEGETE